MNHYRILPLKITCLLTLCAALAPAGAQQSPGTPAKQPPANSTVTATTKPTNETGAGLKKLMVMLVKKELPGEFTFQFAPKVGEPSAPTPLPSPSAADSPIALTVPADIKPAETQLLVNDMGRGNMARLPVTTDKPIALTEASFKFIQTVIVPVQSKGKGVHGVQVTLATADKKYSQTVLLQPSDNGKAIFRNVPLGEPVTATVKYGAYPPEAQTKTLTLDHPAEGYPWSPITVDWADVKTLATPAPAASTSAAPSTLKSEGAPSAGSDSRAPIQPPQTGGGFLSGLVSMIVSLAILGGIAYGLYRAYIGGHLKTAFDRLGIQTGPITATEPAAPNPFTKPERTPIQPITEGTADPLAGGGLVGSMASPGYTPVGAGPRLVATAGTYAGTIYPIADLGVEIGRDPNNAIAMPQDTNVSRRHAVVRMESGQASVMDNGSSNGTYVNGVRIQSQTPHPLRPNDELQIGQTRFRYEA